MEIRELKFRIESVHRAREELTILIEMNNQAKAALLAMEILTLIDLCLPLPSSGGTSDGSSPQVPAMFVFGDSLEDNGNNNYFFSSMAKANYLPYGIDFEGPTGRFCNGKTVVDFLGELLGLPHLPSYASTLYVQGTNILRGVNYASAAGGILDESGRQLGDRYSLSKQVENFKDSLVQIKRLMNGDDKAVGEYLGKSLVFMLVGSNDYVNNYLLPSIYATSQQYNPNDYADLLINRYNDQISALYNLGLRKFFLAGIGPLGCTPNQIATFMPLRGSCVTPVNDMVVMFNERLLSLVNHRNRNLNATADQLPAIFTYGNTFGAFSDILNNPALYGFSVTDRACCGVGLRQAQTTCLPLQIPCSERDQHVFWDAYHPSHAVNQILAKRAYSGPPSDSYPMNVQQMAQV